MKDWLGGIASEEYVGLKPKMYLTLVAILVNIKLNNNVVAKISHNECKNVLLNKKCLRHSVNRIQSKIHRMRTYKINKISSCFDDKSCLIKVFLLVFYSW